MHSDINAPLSVLDLSPVPKGSTAAVALGNSIELAKAVETLGYTRHWVAEHHNFAGIASSSPPVLMAHLAAATDHIRVGSGGLMLPNHSSLAVAEQFGMLEALHPGRIDLGIGRAPGTDQHTAAALRRMVRNAEDEFPRQLRDLLDYFDGNNPHITAVPAEGYRPAIWMLGSSDFSARAAALMGVPFSFAHHFASGGTWDALSVYKDSFKSAQTESGESAPYTKIGVSVICADNREEAEFLAGPTAYSFLSLRQGRPTQMPSPEAVAAMDFNGAEREMMRQWQGPAVLGDPASVREQLNELAARYQVDELMITTMTYDPADRLRSYELIAKG